MKHDNIIDRILDINCIDPIILKIDDKDVCYEQIALVPYDQMMFTILVEKEALQRGEYDCGEVFFVDTKNNELAIVDNVNIISEVFEIYDKMFMEKGD